VLRRSLKHAGIVEGWQHVCRKRGCDHAELAPDDQVCRCPTHGMKLWPKARVRRIRFHDLRHTTASLLMMAGVNPGAVQRIPAPQRSAHHDRGLRVPAARQPAQRNRSPALWHRAG
jgi:integrase